MEVKEAVVEESVETTNSSTRDRPLRTELFLATTHLVESSIFCDVSNESVIYFRRYGLENYGIRGNFKTKFRFTETTCKQDAQKSVQKNVCEFSLGLVLKEI